MVNEVECPPKQEKYICYVVSSFIVHIKFSELLIQIFVRSTESANRLLNTKGFDDFDHDINWQNHEWKYMYIHVYMYIYMQMLQHKGHLQQCHIITDMYMYMCIHALVHILSIILLYMWYHLPILSWYFHLVSWFGEDVSFFYIPKHPIKGMAVSCTDNIIKGIGTTFNYWINITLLYYKPP